MDPSPAQGADPSSALHSVRPRKERGYCHLLASGFAFKGHHLPFGSLKNLLSPCSCLSCWCWQVSHCSKALFSPIIHVAFRQTPQGVDGVLFWDLEDLKRVAIASTYWGWNAAGQARAPGFPGASEEAMDNSREKLLESRNAERTCARTVWQVEASHSFAGAGSCDQRWGRGA